jgi:hypothetical protein
VDAGFDEIVDISAERFFINRIIFFEWSGERGTDAFKLERRPNTST